jgi:hypothetical protein
VRLKPWSARRRNGAVPQAFGLWSSEDLALVVGSQPHDVHGCGSVFRSTGAGTGGERAWVRDVHGEQTQSSSAVRLGWPTSARGHVCMHENGCAISRTTRRSHHQVERHHGGRRLGSPQRNAGELGSVEEQREQGSGFFPSHANTCAGAQARGYDEGACVRASRPQPWRRPGQRWRRDDQEKQAVE